MQAITVKFLSPTNYRGARLKAECDRGSVVIGYPHNHSSGLDAATIALKALVSKFLAEDSARYGTKRNPWSGPWIGGTIKDGTVVFVNQRHAEQITINR